MVNTKVLWTTAVLLGSVLSGPALPQDSGRRYAVLAGVEDYEHENLRKPKLEYAVEDVTELGDVLRAAGYEVVLLTDDTGRRDAKLAPTRANIERAVSEVLRRCGKADTVVLAFAGHGLQFQGAADAYFCPADARPFADEAATLVSVSQVYRELEKSFAGVKVLLVDACRNDPDPGRGRGVDGDNSPPPPKGVAALFSCSAGERAYEHGKLQHGVFFHSVLEGLRGEASDSDKAVTVYSLVDHVTRRVPERVEKLLPGRQQQPNLKGDIQGRPLLLRLAAPILTNSIGMKLVLIPAGEFQMGSTAEDLDRLEALFPGSKRYLEDEKPQHTVRITKPFRAGVHEVTVGQFKAFVAASGYKTEAETDGKGGWGWNEAKGEFEQDPKYTWRNPGFPQADSHPVVLVSWNDAVAFSKWLSAKEGVEYRLLTEAEWEYVCRAGTTSLFPEGDDPESLAKVGNVADARAKAKIPGSTAIQSDDGHLYTAPVGSYRANRWGVHEMHGNVWEWCADGHDASYYAASPRDDPPGAAGASARVNRGGGWDSNPRRCRAANRDGYPPSSRGAVLGFRVVRAP
jgi:formylglycine-generating enzyme required for sulfatase activity